MFNLSNSSTIKRKDTKTKHKKGCPDF